MVIDNNMTRSAISTDITASGALVVKDNIIYGTTGTIGTDTDIDAIQVNTQMVSPQFTNAAAYDFKLLSTSPAINGADAAYAPTTDYYGNARTTPDIGAIEYQTPLPVELLNFKDLHTENGNLLTWQIASEIGVKNFEMEQSIQGQNFEKIAEILAQNRPSRYSYLDERVIPMAYYRLKIKDLDGSYAYSNILSIRRDASAHVRVKPTLVNDVLTVEGVSNYEIYNIVGQLMLQSIENQLNVNHLPQGMYYLRAAGETLKFIKL